MIKFFGVSKIYLSWLKILFMKTLATLLLFCLICTIGYSQNIGFNTKNPTANLHVKGTTRLEELGNVDSLSKLLGIDSAGNVFWKNISSLSSVFWGVKGNSNTNPSVNFLGTTNNQRLVFRTNNIERFTLLENGYAGLNIANPNRLLVLQNSFVQDNAELVLKQKAGSVLGSYLTLDNSANAAGQVWSIGSTGPVNYPQITGALEFYQLGHGTRMILDSTGKFGINLGALNPTAILHVKGSVRFEGLANNNAVSKMLFVDDSGNLFWKTLASSNGWGLTGNAGTNPGVNFIGTTDNQRLVFKTNNTERMTLLTSGNVGINTSSPTSTVQINGSNTLTNAEVTVRQVAGSTLGSYITLDNTNNAGKYWSIGSTGTLNSPGIAGALEFYQLGSGTKMIIDPSGKLGLALGSGSLPTATFHINGTVRLQNLPSGSGSVLVIDDQGNVFKSSQTASRGGNITTSPSEVNALKEEIAAMKSEIEMLKQQIKELKK